MPGRLHGPPWRVTSPRQAPIAVLVLMGFATVVQASLIVPPIVGAIVAHETGHNGWWGVLIGVGVTFAVLNLFAWRERRSKRSTK